MLRSSIATLLFLLTLSGCTLSDAPEVAPASGRLTYQGKPVPGAHLYFAPENGDRMATGYTDQDGRFRLGTFDIVDGAIVGMHHISIDARRPAATSAAGSGLPGEASATTTYEPVIPLKYFSPDTSGLTREVVSGKNEFQLDLVD